MSITIAEILPYLTYAAPPLLGAFIGYLTNRVAIRMLFRPLRQWSVGPLRLPMTPGVIPSKRHELAVNIGEMVGEHLLTSNEINNALQKETFQDHLYTLIETKVGSFLKRDLGPLPSLVPSSYKSYFDIGVKTVSFQTRETVYRYLHSEDCRVLVDRVIDTWIETALAGELETFVHAGRRQRFYEALGRQLGRLMSGDDMEKLIRERILIALLGTLEHRRTLADVLPPTLQGFIVESIKKQTNYLLEKAAEVAKDPEVQEKVIGAVKQAIEEFIATLGPLATMVQSFLDMDQVEEKIRDYLREKEDHIGAMLQNDEIRYRVAAALSQRADQLLRKPIGELLAAVSDVDNERVAGEISRHIVAFMRETGAGERLGSLIAAQCEIQVDHGGRKIGDILESLGSAQEIAACRAWVKREVHAVLTSQKTRGVLDEMIERMVLTLMAKPIGRLDHLIPAGVRGGLYRSLQEMATTMLTSEVPGVVKSLNLRKIVTDRIDSFDLLRLERLLLSIMEEQFKYINLFGALLGFLIGCINLIVLFL